MIFGFYKNEQHFHDSYSQAFGNHHKNIRYLWFFKSHFYSQLCYTTCKQHWQDTPISHFEQRHPRPQSSRALGNKRQYWPGEPLSATVKGMLEVLCCITAQHDKAVLCTQGRYRTGKGQRSACELWHHLESHEPSSILHAWKEGAGGKAVLGAMQAPRTPTCRSWFAASHTGQYWRHLATADLPVCVSICHYLQSIDSKLLPSVYSRQKCYKFDDFKMSCYKTLKNWIRKEKTVIDGYMLQSFPHKPNVKAGFVTVKIVSHRWDL